MKANVIVFEISIFVLSIVFYVGIKRTLGKSRGRALFIGAVLFSLAIETISVWGGLKNFYWYATNDYYKHYPLGGYIIWLGIVPLAAALLFYMVSVISYLASKYMVRKGNLWARSAVAGAVGLAFYMMIEPVAVTNHWWAWNAQSFYLIDVPLFAWVAAFLGVFLLTAAYQLTIVDRADPRPLKNLEDRTIKRWPLKCRQPSTELRWSLLEGVFLFRLLLALAVFAVVMAPVVALLWAVANRGHIPPGW